MYKHHNLIKSPENEEVKIWRYVDFTKLISLLDKHALFFSVATNLSDPFEGSLSKKSLQEREEFIKNVPEFRDDPNLHLESASLPFKNARNFMLLNCWHINEHESAAMWKLYLNSNEGVAIQSTFKRLRESFNSYRDKDVFIGEVDYDFETASMPFGNVLATYFYKRKSYEYERELRAAIMGSLDEAKKRGGEYIPVNLETLIERLYICPTAPNWIDELVRSVVAKYNINASICQSDLKSSPLY